MAEKIEKQDADQKTATSTNLIPVKLVDSCHVESGRQLAPIPELSHTKMVAFSPDGNELAAAAATGETYFFETTTFTQIRKLKTEATWGTMAIAYAPQGDVFATAGGDLHIKLWDARHRSDQPIMVFPESTSNWICTLAFSPYGKRILSTGINGTVRVWHRELGESVLNLQSSRNWIMTGAFAPDGRGIVIGAHGVHAWKAAQTFQPPVIRQPPNRSCFQAFELNAK